MVNGGDGNVWDEIPVDIHVGIVREVSFMELNLGRKIQVGKGEINIELGSFKKYISEKSVWKGDLEADM